MNSKNRALGLAWVAAALLVMVLLISGCRTARKSGFEVAQVGDEVLTSREVTQALEEMELDPEDMHLRAKYINRWVDRQLLLLEARRRGLDEDRSIAEKLEKIREEMTINLLMETAVETPQPDESEVIAYWRDHTGEFTRSSDEVRIIIAVSPDRNTAWAVRNMMDRARPADEITGTYGEVKIDTTGWVPVKQLPQPVRNSIQKLRHGDPSLPFEFEQHWAVTKLIERGKAGEIRSFDEVADRIYARFVAEKTERAEMDFVASLRREARRSGLVRIAAPIENETATEAVVPVPQTDGAEPSSDSLDTPDEGTSR